MSRSSGCPGSLKASPGVVFHIISADFTKLFHAFVRPLFELRSLTAAQRGRRQRRSYPNSAIDRTNRTKSTCREMDLFWQICCRCQ